MSMKLRAIPQIPAGLDPQLARLIAALKENIEQLSEHINAPIEPENLSQGAPLWSDDGNLILSPESEFGWGPNTRAISANGASVMLYGGPEGGAYLCGNCYHDGTNWRYVADGTATCVASSGRGGIMNFRFAAAGVANAVIAWTTLFGAEATQLGTLRMPHSILDMHRVSMPINHGRYIHLKTDINVTAETQMFSFRFRGHAYSGTPPAIDAGLAFYSYPPNSNVISVGTSGSHTCSAYKSADNNAVLVIDVVSGYYTAFTLSQYTTAQGLRRANITAEGHHTAATGLY